MGRKKTKKCSLCSVKKKNWEEDKFFGINCKEKFIPLVVLKEHKNILTDEEKEELNKTLLAHHPKSKMDPKLDHVNGHWCCYLKRK